jgi:hypothetical protein
MSTSFKSIQSVIAFVLVLSVHSFLSVREAPCGTRDENEEHDFSLFVLVLPPLLALLFAVVKKVKRVSLLVFAFVRILVVVVAKPPLLVKEVIIIITEREREIIPIPKGTDNRDQNVVIPYTPPPFVSLERRSNTTTNTNSLLSLSLARSVNYHEYDALLSLKVFLSDVYYSNDICEGSSTVIFLSILHSTKHFTRDEIFVFLTL